MILLSIIHSPSHFSPLLFLYTEFKKRHGHMPSKIEKEPIRHLYVKYNEIKNTLSEKEGKGEEASTKGSTSEVVVDLASSTASSSGGSVKASNLKALLIEKRSLQAKLRDYESKFELSQGRKVKYHKDISPVENDYQRYKLLKGMLKSAGYVSSKQK